MQHRILFLILLLGFQITKAQTGTIKGFVYEKESGEPMSYINVVLQGKNIGVQTDINGYFSIPQVPVGKQTIWTTVLGYDTAKATFNVKSGDILTQKLYISQKGLVLNDVEVTAHKTEKITQINAGATTITPREMKLMPSAGGEPDLSQYLQVMPGVVFTGDQGGQLYIRGGSPAQTGILLDGVTIYNPFHSIGLYSVFETDAIRNVEVQSAGFNAQYGNRTSAILDIRTKDGNKNRLAGKVSASPIMFRTMLEGPLVKPKKPDGSGLSFLVSLKKSYLDETSKPMYSGLGKAFTYGLPYSFTDLFGKVTFSGDNGSKLNLFGFSFDDNARALDSAGRDQATFNWQARGGGATFVVTPGNSAALISGKMAFSRYDINSLEVGLSNRSRNSGINGFEGGIDFTYFLPGYSQVKYGMEVSGLSTTLDYINSANITSQLERKNTLGSLFFMFRKNFNEKLIIEPGVRLQYYSSLSKFSVEPRIGLKYNASANVRFKGAAGIYTQNIISTKSDLDIVNFFSGFLLSPDQEIKDTKGNVVTTNLQQAYHLIAGMEFDIKDFEFNIEPWYKNFTRNIELNRAKKTFNDADFTAGDGQAYGLDFTAKYTKGRLFFWGVFSYQKVTYTTLVAKSVLDNPTVQTYAPPFDRRFNMNIVCSYSAGKKKDLELSLRYNLGSPFPFTQTQGFYEDINLSQNGLSTNINQQNGQMGIIYADQINGGRLSYFHRLDLSAKKRFIITEHNNIEATLSVTNVYNRNNIFYLERTASKNSRRYQLPIFPSLNITWNF